MFSVTVNTSAFTNTLQKYAALTGKAVGAVVREQAKLLAKRLVDLTYPKTAAMGKKRVAIDIAKVYLRNEWFETQFSFSNKKLGKRIKDAVKSRNTGELQDIFKRSNSLRKLHVEPFDKSRHLLARRHGRVNYKQPYSFPVADQSKVKALIEEKKKKVGGAKAGWASCLTALGGNSPAWLKQSNGSVTDDSTNQSNPSITLTNNVRYFADLDSKASIVTRAMEGRANDMMKAAANAIQRAKAKAGIFP